MQVSSRARAGLRQGSDRAAKGFRLVLKCAFEAFVNIAALWGRQIRALSIYIYIEREREIFYVVCVHFMYIPLPDEPCFALVLCPYTFKTYYYQKLGICFDVYKLTQTLAGLRQGSGQGSDRAPAVAFFKN